MTFIQYFRHRRSWLPHLLLVLLIQNFCDLRHVSSYEPRLVDPLRESWRVRSFAQLKGRGLRCIGEDSSGAIWFGVKSGAVCYDGYRWLDYEASSGLPSAVNSFASTGNNLFAATQSSIHVFHEGRFRRVFPSSGETFCGIESLATGADGSLWAATHRGALQFRGLKTTSHQTRWNSVSLYATQELVDSLADDLAAERIDASVVDAPDRAKWKPGIGEMVAGISHEINQPLATIANFSAASLLVLNQQSDRPEQGDGKPDVRHWLERIQEQTHRINKIIQSLRRFGRPNSNQAAAE